MSLRLPPDFERVFGVSYNDNQRQALADIPFTEDVLRQCAGTHMLFPGYALSLLDVQSKYAGLFFWNTGGWHASVKHNFSRVPMPVRWHLLRMEPVPGSVNRNWKEQQSLLRPDEEVPSAATVAFATMLHSNATGQRLFERTYVRTSDMDADDVRVNVGHFDSDGFYVYNYWDAYRGGSLGVASSRKS